jgi:ATP/ADP translocase
MTDDTSSLWMIFVLFVCGAAVLGGLMPTVGTVWITGVTYPLMVLLTLIGWGILIHHEQVDLETVAIGAAASLVMALPVTLLARCADRILSRYAKFPNGDNTDAM